MRILHHDSLDSTSTQAARLIEAGDPGDVWVQANIQTAGRGRLGRAWTSSSGNLFATYIFYPPVDITRAALYGFVAANAVADTVAAYLPHGDIKIKWPNDVQLGGAKISGILLESGHLQGRLWLSVGIGINLINCPDNTPYAVTNISAHINSDDPEDIPDPMAALAILAARFDAGSAQFARQGFEPVRRAWLARAAGLNETVSASAKDGKIIGTLRGLSNAGELEVRLPTGRDTLISSGEVFLGI